MTMPYSPSRAVYEGNDAATRFPFSFKVWDASQLVVTLTSPGGATTEASGWTADIGASGGEIVYLHKAAPLPAGWKLAVTRNMPFTQEVNLVSASRFDPQVIEDALDQATAERQQVKEMLGRAVILPSTSDETPQDVVLAVYAAHDKAQNASSDAQAAKAAAAAAVTAATAQADRAQGAANAAEAAAGTAANDARLAVAAELNRASNEADRAQSEADRALSEANRAQSLSNIGPAKADKLGFVKIGEGIVVTDDGTISVTPINLASSEKAGTVKPGKGMTVTNDGTLNVSYWDAFPPYVPIPIWGVTFGGSDGRRAIMPGETSPRADWIKCDGGSNGKGSTMPNLAGRAIIGASSAKAAGSTGGADTHSHTITGNVGWTTLTSNELVSHNHAYTASNNMNMDVGRNVGNGYSYVNQGDYGARCEVVGLSWAHNHSITAWSNDASNLNPYCAMHFVMRVL